MINLIFPTLFFSDNLVSQKERNSIYETRSYEIRKEYPSEVDWLCGTYASLNKYNLKVDPLFEPLFEEVTENVVKFSHEYGHNHVSCRCIDAWVNISGPKDFQEYHIHGNSHFSAVYYVKVPEDSGNLVFRSFEADCDMFPLSISTFSDYPASFKTWGHVPAEGDLVIFRSNVRHMVTQNLSNQERISIAMNFVLD